MDTFAEPFLVCRIHLFCTIIAEFICFAQPLQNSPTLHNGCRIHLFAQPLQNLPACFAQLAEFTNFVQLLQNSPILHSNSPLPPQNFNLSDICTTMQNSPILHNFCRIHLFCETIEKCLLFFPNNWTIHLFCTTIVEVTFLSYNCRICLFYTKS